MFPNVRKAESIANVYVSSLHANILIKFISLMLVLDAFRVSKTLSLQ